MFMTVWHNMQQTHSLTANAVHFWYTKQLPKQTRNYCWLDSHEQTSNKLFISINIARLARCDAKWHLQNYDRFAECVAAKDLGWACRANLEILVLTNICIRQPCHKANHRGVQKMSKRNTILEHRVSMKAYAMRIWQKIRYNNDPNRTQQSECGKLLLCSCILVCPHKMQMQDLIAKKRTKTVYFNDISNINHFWHPRCKDSPCIAYSAWGLMVCIGLCRPCWTCFFAEMKTIIVGHLNGSNV